MSLLPLWLALGLLLLSSSIHAEKGLTGWRCVEDWGEGAEPKWSGIAVRLSPDGVNPECASKDGKTCMRVSAGGYCKPYDGPKLDTLDLTPLRCGKGHQAAWGANNTGYNQGARHWCNIVKAGIAKRPSGFTGAVCKSGSQCASGICVRAQPPGRPANQTSTRSTAINSFCGCRNSAQCGRLHYCGPDTTCVVKRYKGAACSAAEQCLSGTCRSGRCTCTADGHCPPDQYCLPASPNNSSSLGACRPLKIFNQACSSSRECFARLCLKGVCKDCASSKDCVRATCNTATNACNDTDYMVNVCKTSKECPAQGPCSKGKCTCTTDAHCGSYARNFYRCRRAVNPSDNTCLVAFKDGTCHSDKVCGVPSSEDAYEVLGKCIGKTCAQCAEPNVAAAWHPGESNLDNGMLWRTCNVQTYLYQ